MKLLTILIIALITISSCADFRVKRHYKNIHPELMPYVNEFINASKGKVTEEDISDLTMGFKIYKKGRRGIAGTCHPMGFLTEIDINIEWWGINVSSLERQELIFHELGHCILRRGHTELIYSNGVVGFIEKVLFKLGIFERKGLLSDGCPSSMMHPIVLGKGCIMSNYLYYIEELFNKVDYDDFIEKNSFNLYIKINCQMPTVINNTFTWSKEDQSTLDRARNTCIEKYGSCLGVFTKKAEGEYTAICN